MTIDPSGLAAAAASLTVGELFAQQARLTPDRIALQTANESLTFAELAKAVGRMAHWLLAAGAGPGERVAILSENRREYLVLLLAGATTGAIVTCLNLREGAAQLAHCIGLTRPALALVSPRFAEHRTLFASVPRVAELGPAFDAELAALPSTPVAIPAPDGEATLHILFTSGTTGAAKAACISHRAVIARGAAGLVDAVQRRGATYLAWPPMFHMAGAEASLHTLLYGGKVVVMDGFDAAEMAGLLASEDNLGWVNLMPGMVDRLIAHMREHGMAAQPIDLIGSAPDLFPRHQVAAAMELFQAPFRNTYGSTETGPVPACAGTIPPGASLDDFGKLQSSLCLVRLVDADDCDVATGESGELLMKGPTLFSGYWGMPAETAAAFAGGWYRTGDVFTRAGDGLLRFIDRRKYLIKSGGENIYPAELEQVLLGSARVAEAVVVRQPDPEWGEVPVACVVRADPELTAAEVVAICRAQVASFKVPRAVHFLTAADLPRSASGKVMRHEVEQTLAMARPARACSRL